jgi:putative ABC transport system permease protein
MTAWESTQVALRTLRANPLRSLLTMLGIIIGVSAVITMIAVGAGAHSQIAQQIRSLGANLLLVQPGTAREGGARRETGSRHTLTESDAVAIRRDIPYANIAVPSVRGTAQVVHGSRNWSTTINGTEPDYLVAREWSVASGRAFTTQEVHEAAKSAVIGRTVADALFGDVDPIGRLIRIGNVPFTVAGVLSRKGLSGVGRDQDDIVFIPISTAKVRLTGAAHEVSREAVDYILVKVVDDDAMKAAQAGIRSLLRQRHRLMPHAEDDFQAQNPAAIMSARQEATRTFTLLLAAVASVSMIVGGISIMNIMLVSITERTREIGLRLAIGARRRDILNQFLIEALSFCLLGGLMGILVGVGASIAVAELTGWPMLIGPQAVGFAFGFAGVIGIIFGLYPALKASRLDPLEALRHE